jgi:molybdenum cofactor biosynthesis enzyme MoaA
MSSIYTAPVYKLKELNNLFIELTAKNCNQRCKCCYIDFPINSKIVKDFISLDRIKEALRIFRWLN